MTSQVENLRQTYDNLTTNRKIYFVIWPLICMLRHFTIILNPSLGTLKPQSNGPIYSNTVIGALAVDE